MFGGVGAPSAIGPEPRRRLSRAVTASAVALALLSSALPASAATTWTAPTPNAQFDYQIGGAYTPPTGTTVLSRDRRDVPAAGKYTICYVNAFQTQDDELDRVWKQHQDLLLAKPGVHVPADADPTVKADVQKYWVSDSGWSEILLDISSSSKREELADIVGGWIDSCAQDGFQALEPDNLDSWTRNRNSERLLTQQNAVDYAALLAERAHAAGLAFAQKNTPALSGSKADIGFDFAIAEECARYNECDSYTDDYGNNVIVVEYRRQDFDTACHAPDVGGDLSVVLRNRNVTPKGSSGFVYDAC